MDRQKGTDSAEALQYHNNCLQMLIPTLSGVQENVTDVILAAVAILRQHEEMDRMLHVRLCIGIDTYINPHR